MSYQQQPTAEQIRAARGYFFVKPLPPYAEVVNKPLRALSKTENEAVTKRREQVHLHLPEMLPFIQELHKQGMIDGWRSVGELVFIDVAQSEGNIRELN